MKWLAAARRYLGLGAPSWAAWLSIIAGALGEQLDDAQREHFRRVFARDPLQRACRELWLAIGRRGGKDFVATRLAIYLALFRKWKLAPGETGVILLLAVDRAQAKVAFNYLRGALESHEQLWAEVEGVTADTIRLVNGIEIQVGTSDFAAVRGRTILVALLDEFAFWGVEQATEVLRALRPAQATQPQAMIVVISSAYASHGPFFETFRRYYGADDPRVLFGRATTRDTNPTVSEEFIADELARDPASASAEYLSQFRSDVSSFLDADLIDKATRNAPREIEHTAMTPTGGHRRYFAGLDVSGGRGDAAALAIVFVEADARRVALTRHWPSPHNPIVVAGEVAKVLHAYGLQSALSDAYAAEFSTATYSEAGVALAPAGVTRSEAYIALLPLFTTGRVEIPDHPTLRAELLALERRTSANGRDIIDHPPHGHDDCANAVALACYAARSVGTCDAPAIVIPGDFAVAHGAATGDWSMYAGTSFKTDW